MNSRDYLSRTPAAVAGLLAGLLVSSCSVPDPAVSADQEASSEPQVLAVIGEQEITEPQVAELMKAQLLNVERQRRQVLEQGLEQLVSDRLLELEADRRGVSREQLLAAEVEAKLRQPTPDEIDAFYEQQKARIRQPKEQVVEQIGEFLRQQHRRSATERLVDELKVRHQYRLLLEPLRVTVEAAGHPAKGPESAPVTIVEFSDFECPYCARVNPSLSQVLETYGDKVRLVFRQFPLNNIHPQAQKAAEASLCARDQGRFWEMHDAMFKEQRNLGVEQLKQKAARLGLETEAFNACLDSSRYAEAVAEDVEAGSRLGVTGTPAMFVNGRLLSGAVPYDEIAKLIDEELDATQAGSS